MLDCFGTDVSEVGLHQDPLPSRVSGLIASLSDLLREINGRIA